MLQMASGLRIDEFVEDMIGSMSRTKPVFIFDPDKTPTPGWIKSRTSAIMPATENDPIDDETIKARVRLLMETDDVDIIFFMSYGHEDLIRDVFNDLELFKTKICVVIPYGDVIGLKSRLNSQLYLFEIVEGYINLYESYQIRSSRDQSNNRISAHLKVSL